MALRSGSQSNAGAWIPESHYTMHMRKGCIRAKCFGRQLSIKKLRL